MIENATAIAERAAGLPVTAFRHAEQVYAIAEARRRLPARRVYLAPGGDPRTITASILPTARRRASSPPARSNHFASRSTSSS